MLDRKHLDVDPIKSVGQHTGDRPPAHGRLLPDHRRGRRLNTRGRGPHRIPALIAGSAALGPDVTPRNVERWMGRPTAIHQVDHRELPPGCPPSRSSPGPPLADRVTRGSAERGQQRDAAGKAPPGADSAAQPAGRGSVLGAILLSRDALGAVVEAGLRYDDFYKPAHQHIFDVAVAVSQSGRPSTRSPSPRSCRGSVTARTSRRRRGVARPAERHSGDLQRRVVCQHRPGRGDAPPADPRRRRHLRDRLQPSRQRRRCPRRSREPGVPSPSGASTDSYGTSAS